MGRGRQKAKATKQAREMKYYTIDTDYNQLQKELSGSSNNDSLNKSVDDQPLAPQEKSDSSSEDSSTHSDDYYENLAAKYADLYDENTNAS